MKLLVTAGPTREFFDPVRFLSNPSTGKMGYAVAQAAKERGHEVILISGPSQLPPPKGTTFIAVETADQMQDKVKEWFDACDAVVMTAAVSDFKPRNRAPQKVKKEGSESVFLEFVRTPDILSELGKNKEKKLLIGFAAESENVLENAQKKLAAKNLDMIIANDISDKDGGFGAETNRVHFLYPDGRIEALPKMSKLEIAQRLIKKIETKFIP